MRKFGQNISACQVCCAKSGSRRTTQNTLNPDWTTNINKHFKFFVDIRCPIRVECILSCSTTSAFCTANLARAYILAEFSHSLTDFKANLSSLIKVSLF
jgi:hypothetical protein